MALATPEGWTYFAAEGQDADDVVAYLRALGGNPFPEAVYSDDQVLAALTLAVREFERATGGRVFVAREGTIAVRGEGVRQLWLPEPIVDVTEVRISGSVVDLAALDVHKGTQADADGTDPRNDPWISWIQDFAGAGYLGGVGGGAWGAGRWPPEGAGPIVEIDGTFGFVEDDGLTPPLVRLAVLGILQRQLVPLNDYEGRGDFMRGAVIQEQTRGRGYMLSQARLSSGVFLDREIDRIVATYKRPERVLISRSRRPGRALRPPLY